MYTKTSILKAVIIFTAPSLPLLAQNESDETVELSPLTVSATRTERLEINTPGAIALIDLSDTQRSSLQNLFKDEPLISVPFSFSGSGVAYQRGGAQSVNVRGVEGNRIRLQIDGARLPDEFRLGGSEPVGRDYLDPELFKRVEILAGSASALYGSDALGGVVSFATKDPSDYVSSDAIDHYASAKLSYQSADDSVSGSFTGAKAFENWETLLVHTRREGNETENNGSVAPNPQNYATQATLAKAAFQVDERNRFTLSLDHYERDWSTEKNNLETASRFGGITTHLSQDSLTERTKLSLGHQFDAGGRSSFLFDTLETQVYWQDSEAIDYTDEHRVYDPPSRSYGAFRDRDIETSFLNETLGASLNAVKSLGERQRFAYGIEYTTTETRKPWAADIESGSRGKYREESLRMATTDTERLGVYLQDEIEWTFANERKFVLIPGLRVENFKLTPDNSPEYLAVTAGAAAPTFDETAVSPKLGALISLVEGLNLYAQYNHGFRYPSAEDLTATFTNSIARYRTLPNPNLAEEESDAFEVGLKGRIGNALTIRFAAFRTDYENFIEQIAFAPMQYQDFANWRSGTFMTQNRNDAQIDGAELSATLDFGQLGDSFQGFSLATAIGRAQGDFLEDDGTRQPLETVDPLRASARLRYVAPGSRLGGSFGLRYSDTREQGDESVFNTPSHTIADLSLWYKATDRLALNLELDNLFDEKYWTYHSTRGLASSAASEIERRAQPGLNASLSARFRF